MSVKASVLVAQALTTRFHLWIESPLPAIRCTYKSLLSYGKRTVQKA